MKEIHIHTVFDKNSIDYYKFMVESTLERVKYKELIYLHGYFIKSEPTSHIIEYCKYKKINLISTGVSGNGTDGHVACLNYVFKNFIPNQINIISDSDTAICLDNFDEWVRENIKEYSLIGTRYEDIGGPCVEKNYPIVETLYQTYKSKPSATWCAFSPDNKFDKLTFKNCNTQSSCIKVTTEKLVNKSITSLIL